MKAVRPDKGKIYHGGCNGCTTPQKYCASCMYFDFKAYSGKPDYNSITIIEKVMRGEAVEAPNIIIIEGVEYMKVNAGT